MKVLLDTHIWIWWLLVCERLSIARRPVAQRAPLEGVLQAFPFGLTEYHSARPKQPRHPKIPVLKLFGWKGFERLQLLQLARLTLAGCRQES